MLWVKLFSCLPQQDDAILPRLILNGNGIFKINLKNHASGISLAPRKRGLFIENNNVAIY
ncbi:TPA: hypothetical protein I7730_00285 [Vibrio vulnificus]|uniref:Uncharacterized protein n=1 Tax=Vibrio vulnificus TaxID=672 RepID=A0A8H9K5G2_VIBVL|nr:hypothetical protein [Vibrio vulnificus]